MDSHAPSALLRRGPLQLAPVPSAGVESWAVHGDVWAGSERFSVALALTVLRDHTSGQLGAALFTQAVNAGTGAVHEQLKFSGDFGALTDRLARVVARGRLPRGAGPLVTPLMALRRQASARLAGAGRGRVDPKGPRLLDDPFALSWAGVLMGLDVKTGTLRLTLPLAEGRGLEASLALPDEIMDEETHRLAEGWSGGHWVQSAPALPLRGRIGTVQAEGLLWFTRHWGDVEGWAIGRLPGRRKARALLSRAEISVTLSEDWQLVAFRQGQLPGDDTLATAAVLFERGQPVRLPGGVRLTPLDHWDSPESGARWPERWEVVAPDVELAATLSTIGPAGEVVVPGGLSFWSGAARMEGHLAGEAFAVPGRLDMAGYGACLTVAERIRRRMRAGV